MNNPICGCGFFKSEHVVGDGCPYQATFFHEKELYLCSICGEPEDHLNHYDDYTWDTYHRKDHNFEV